MIQVLTVIDEGTVTNAMKEDGSLKTKKPIKERGTVNPETVEPGGQMCWVLSLIQISLTLLICTGLYQVRPTFPIILTTTTKENCSSLYKLQKFKPSPAGQKQLPFPFLSKPSKSARMGQGCTGISSLKTRKKGSSLDLLELLVCLSSHTASIWVFPIAPPQWYLVVPFKKCAEKCHCYRMIMLL